MKDPETGAMLAPRKPRVLSVVEELTELKALVSRMKTRLNRLEPWVVGVESHKIVADGLADNGKLGYEIH